MKKILNLLSKAVVLTAIVLLSFGCAKKSDQQSGAKSAPEWPTKDINIIVGYGPGGSTDTFARIFAKYLSPVIGANVVVSNISGGGGAVGYVQTQTSDADGCTVVVSNGSLMTLGGIGNVDFEYSSFDNIARVIVEDETICVGKNAEWDNVKEMVDYAKAHPKALKVGFAGMGGFTYLAANKFIETTGIEVIGVAYGSGSEAVAGLLGGFVDFIVQQPGEIYSQYEAGELKALAVAGDERNPLLSEVPTCKESGIDIEMSQWRGFSAPKGIPAAATEKWYDAVKKVTGNEEFKAEIQKVLLANTKPIIGDDFESWLKMEAAWIYPLIESLGLKNN